MSKKKKKKKKKKKMGGYVYSQGQIYPEATWGQVPLVKTN
jgi:hypothetical protein